MAGIALSGLSSGLDTTALITQLMQVEAVPQTQLKNQATSTQATISALQGLNSQISDLSTLATGNAAAGALNLFSTSTSASNVSATASTTASPGSIDITVNQLAQSQVSVSGVMQDPSSNLSTLSIVVGGVTKQITPASSSLDDVVTAINAAGAGVSATKVSVSPGNYRLQFAATASGTAGGFQILDATGATLPLTDTTTAQDAQVTLWANDPSLSQSITSSTNTFANILTGVSMTVSATSATPTTVTVAQDVNKVSGVASGLVSALNNIFAVITNRSAVTTSTDTAGKQTTTAGAFTGDSTIQTINQNLLSAATMPVNGHSPSEYGISINKSGSIDFDATKFAASMASDPAGTQNVLQTIAQRVSTAATAISDPYTGTLTGAITGQKSTVDDLNKQISDWDDRLATRQAILTKTYSDMEVALNTIKSQGSYLTSQLASLPTMSSSSSSSSTSMFG